MGCSKSKQLKKKYKKNKHNINKWKKTANCENSLIFPWSRESNFLISCFAASNTSGAVILYGHN